MKLTFNHSDCNIQDQSFISSSPQSRQIILNRVRIQPQNRRIPLHIKRRLISMVTLQSYRIKEAAQLLNISYSTAKKTFKTFRNSRKEQIELIRDNSNCTVCKYCDIYDCQFSLNKHICVVSTLGGKLQEQKQIKSILQQYSQ